MSDCVMCSSQFKFNMHCIKCVCKHLRMIYRPMGFNKVEYLNGICSKYNHDRGEVLIQLKINSEVKNGESILS